MPAFLKKRDNILVLAFGLVLVFFIGRMLQMQLIQGDEYESQIYKGTIKTQTVEAARGGHALAAGALRPGQCPGEE